MATKVRAKPRKLTADEMQQVNDLFDRKYSRTIDTLSAIGTWSSLSLIIPTVAIGILGLISWNAVGQAIREEARDVNISYIGSQLTRNETFLTALSNVAFPTGVIVAVPTDSVDGTGNPVCPPGWRYVSEANGRFIAGANPVVNDQIATREGGTIFNGGSIKSSGLTKSVSIPKETSLTRSEITYFGGPANQAETVPAFIALHFCLHGDAQVSKAKGDDQ